MQKPCLQAIRAFIPKRIYILFSRTIIFLRKHQSLKVIYTQDHPFDQSSQQRQNQFQLHTYRRYVRQTNFLLSTTSKHRVVHIQEGSEKCMPFKIIHAPMQSCTNTASTRSLSCCFFFFSLPLFTITQNFWLRV